MKKTACGAATASLFCNVWENVKKRRQRMMWIKPCIAGRLDFGAYIMHALASELRTEDELTNQNFWRMDLQ
jgi:hypothetical protein